MLDSLPPEIIEQILGHLPTASSIANVARTNHKLHSVVSGEDYGIFRNFVQKAFPTINTPPLWRSMGCALTSRSRAWDRRSFIARECHPPLDEAAHNGRTPYQRFGFIPVIDSYEQWTNSHRKEVMTFGAGGRLRLRTIEKDRTEWKTFRLPDDHIAHNDILDVRLLRPHQHHNIHGETIILRRANREIVKLESGVGKDNISQTSRFVVDGSHVDCMDISMDIQPLVATCNTKSLQLYPANGDSDIVRPISTFSFAQNFDVKHRKRALKFLDEHTLAAAVQFVEGRERAPILIYNVTPTGPIASPLQPSTNIDVEHPLRGRHGANVVTKLDETSSLAGRPGQVFLSGWSDGVTRLHDLRVPSKPVAQYIDTVDDGQILSLAAVGHERFFAGSHQNACLKCFDMRMPGSRTYSYLDVQPRPNNQSTRTVTDSKPSASYKRDINIFLALTVQRNRLWAPLPRQQNATNLPRYRGSIYSLSTPSPSSTTLFAGIENHVIQLDFVNTDDILRKWNGACDPSAGLSTLTTKPEIDNVLSLSCYEKPRAGYVATDPVLLRKQVNWHETIGGIDDAQYGPVEDGWDHRWRLTRSWKNQGKGWRRRNG